MSLIAILSPFDLIDGETWNYLRNQEFLNHRQIPKDFFIKSFGTGIIFNAELEDKPGEEGLIECIKFLSFFIFFFLIKNLVFLILLLLLLQRLFCSSFNFFYSPIEDRISLAHRLHYFLLDWNFSGSRINFLAG